MGNGLKTIFSRLTTIEGAETVLNGANVAMRDMAGNVRPVSDIIEDLAGNWTTLTDEQRQNLGVTLAGRFQLTRFLALMNNFEIAQSATATAINSSGSAMKEQEKYADSLEARLNRLDTAWNKFTLSVGEAVLTDGLIGGIESLNDLATGVAKLVDKFGLLSGLFGIVGVATVALSTKFRTFTSALLLGTTGMTRMQLASVGLTAGMSRLGIATVGVKTALRGLLASTVVGAVFVGIGFALEKLIGKYSEAKQAQEEFEATQQKGVEALSTNREQTEKLVDQYNHLTEARKKMGESWTVEQEEKYLALQQEIGDQYPQLISYIDAAGNKHLKSKDQIEEEIKATEKLIVAKKEELKLRALDNLTKALDNRDDIDDDINKKQREIKDTEKYSGKTFELATAKAKTEVASLQQQWSQASQKITSEVLKIADAYVTLDIDPNIKQGMDEFVQSLDLSKLKPEQLEIYAKRIGETFNELQTAYDAGNKDNFDKAKQALIDYAEKMGATELQAKAFSLSFDGLKEATEKGASAVFAGKDGMDGLDDSMSNLVDSTMDVTNAQGELVSVSERLVGVSEDQISQIQEHIAAYQLLADVENQSKEQKLMLAEATEYLANMYPHLAKGSKINVDAMQKEAEQTDILLKAIEEMKKGHLSAEEQMTLTSALNGKSRLKILLEQAKAYESFARKLAQEAAALGNSDFARSQDAEIQARKFMGKATEGYADFSKELEALMPDMDRWINQLAQVTDYQGKNYKATEKSTYIADQYRLALEVVNAEIEKQNNLQSRLSKYSAEYQQSLRREIDLMKQKKRLLEAQAKLMQSQIASGNVTQYGISSSSKSSSSSYAPVSGGGSSGQIWNFFKSKGFSDAIVAGIMGNLKLESGLNPNALNKSSGAFGIAQWLGGRKTGLQNFARQRGTSSADLNTQLEWLWQELNSSEKKTLNYLNGNQGASASTIAAMFDKLFERSEGTHIPQRQQYANQFLQQFAGTVGVVGTVSGDASRTEAERQQAVDEAKLDLIGIQSELINIDNAIYALEREIVQNKIDSVMHGFDRYLADLDSSIEHSRLSMERWAEGSREWTFEVNKQIKSMQHRRVVVTQEIEALQKLIKTENLDVEQKEQLADRIRELTTEGYDYLNQIGAMYDELIRVQSDEKIGEINEAYDEQIKILQEKLDLLDKQEKTEERIKQLNELNMELDKAKTDKRFEYINEDGQVELTYDKGRVAELEKQKRELEEQWAKEDEKQSLQDQIAQLETDRESAIEKLMKLQEDYMNAGFGSFMSLENIMKNFVKDLASIFNTSLPKHHTGGIVGGTTSKLGQLMHKMFNLKTNEQLSVLKQGEVVTNPALPIVQSNMKNLFDMINTGRQSPSVSNVKNITIQNLTVKANNPMEFFNGLENALRSQ